MIENKNVQFFTPSALKEYLKIELYHSLDIYSLHTKLSTPERISEQEGVESFYCKDFFLLLSDFYIFLAKLRYLVNSAHQNKNDYNRFVEDEYDKFIKKIDEFIFNLFKPQERRNVNLLEEIVIYTYYNFIQSNLEVILNNPNRVVLEPDRDIPSLIEKRFVKDPATFAEQSDPNQYKRLLKNKQQRYNGVDRASYWEQHVNKVKRTLLYSNIEPKITGFLTQHSANIERLNNLTVIFLLLILTKYHFILHRYAHEAYEFKNLPQHMDAVANKSKIIRAQKIFTFTRLVAKYFPRVFVPDGEKESKAIAKAIEILSYIRRGNAYESLGEIEKAFNDYTSADKQASLIREEYRNSNEEFIILYRDLITPYIYSLKGELYRKDHAFYNAHQYYCNAINRFEDDRDKKKEDQIGKLLNQSLKIVRLKIVKGKTFLELGEFRKSLKWYLKALEHLLRIFGLAQGESTAFSILFNYLAERRLDPKLIKGPLFKELKNVIESVEKDILNNNTLLANYGILLSDLFNRISLIIFLLNLPDYNREGVIQIKHKYKEAVSQNERDNLRNNLCRNLLAWRWLLLALRFNPKNSLGRFNEIIFGLETTCEEVKNECDKMRQELGVKTCEGGELMEFGNPRDIVYRIISKETLENLLKVNEKDDGDENIAKGLLQRLLLHTEDFSMKNAELYRYLIKDPHEIIQRMREELGVGTYESGGLMECGSTQDMSSNIYFYILQRWSSINPALPRPSTFKMKGGGYFLIFKGKGIAIDPGLNFVENLYSEGFSIADIDYVVVTHDHIDHTADIDTILALHYKRSKIGHQKCMTLLLNPSVSLRYGFILHQDRKLFKKMELPIGQRIELFDDLILEPKKVKHLDLSSPKESSSIGLILTFYPSKREEEFKIGITSDTEYSDSIMDQFLDVDILIVHIGGAPFRELTELCGIKQPLQSKKIQELLENIESSVSKEIIYSLGFYSNKEDHMLLSGVLKTYKKFIERNQKPDKGKLFVISEISEEMGSYRHKVSGLLDQQYTGKKVKCLTADIGMALRIRPTTPPNGRIEVRCSRCNLNNDYTEDDKFHNPNNIKEVCLKREDEGIFYYCRRHDPENTDRDDIEQYGFAERIEKYQPFKHIDIRIT